jgi:uncharacterized membrane protein YeaQ/YmgE (transglycosylase-associated protein family)
MIMFLLWLAIVGFIAGLLARAIVPGDDAMGILGTIFLGLVGSVVGGFLVAVLFRPDGNDDLYAPVGLIGSVVGAVIVLMLYRMANGRRALSR